MHTIALNITQLAYAFSMARDTIRKRMDEAGISPVARSNGIAGNTLELFDGSGIDSASERGRDVYDLRTVIPVLAGGVEGDPFRKKAQKQAELLDLQLAVKRGQLLERHDVEQEFSRTQKITALVFDTLPDIVERDCGASPDQIARIEKAIDVAREGLYLKLIGEGGDE